ncbi:hypothetical protein [Hydrogenovibrio sp. JE_KL2]|uniref:hypothetical protein n=1 Tax=Hydrogenovibrio sp. JE_KL2 TaxID=2651188 RepID=UPI00128C60AF|nr:hypothetical protein [Hydrogenovibrio sp. JE_KL2]MPQ77355.1 hypothetical protein [Hydrogenovibrio sp. JE_KL2]
MMDSLEKLKQLRKEHTDTIPFKSLVQFEKWADEVYPLLKFNDPLSQRFNRARLKAALDLPYGPTQSAIEQINIAIDTVNEAIEKLEAMPHSFFSREGHFRTKWRTRFNEHPIRLSSIVGLIFFILGIGLTALFAC